MKVSYSKIQCFKECPKKYYFKHNQKYYPIKKGSPLIFGSLIDETLNHVLKAKQQNTRIDVLSLYKENTSKIDFSNVNFFKSDFSHYLLDMEMTQKQADEYIKDLKENNIEEYSKLCKDSLLKKGELIIDLFQNEIIDLLDSIENIQEQLNVKNEENDELVCVIDFIAKVNLDKMMLNPNVYISPHVHMLSDKNQRVVFDNKTSSAAYKEDVIKTSDQLSIYSEFYETEVCGYVVFNKKILKNKQMKYQIILDTIDKNYQKEVFLSLQNTINEIKLSNESNFFEKNLKSCFSYGQKCDYYDLCTKKSTEGLVKKEDK